MKSPGLTIELTSSGISRVVIHTTDEDYEQAFSLLRRALPRIEQLDRDARQPVAHRESSPRST